MFMLDTDKILNSLSHTDMIDELAAMHRGPIGLIDEITISKNGGGGHLDLKCSLPARPDSTCRMK
jgi:hypothetical protein